jgi:protein SCO1/2
VPLRARLALFLAATFAIVAAGAVVFAAGDDDRPSRTPGFEGAIRPPGIPPADFTLTDERGRTTTLEDLEGSPAVVTFLYTTCEDTCPTVAQQVVGALDRLGHDVPAVAIAVDPPRDTPATARRFLAEQKLAGRLRFLTGPEPELRKQWKAYGIRRQQADLEHSAHVVVLDRHGRQRVGFPPGQVTPDALAHDIAALEDE